MKPEGLGIVCLRRGGPRSERPPDWEARRHALEAAFWAKNLKPFEDALPRIRLNRGNARAARLVADVLAEVEAAQGTEAALLERGLLAQRWRENPGCQHAGAGPYGGSS